MKRVVLFVGSVAVAAVGFAHQPPGDPVPPSPRVLPMSVVPASATRRAETPTPPWTGAGWTYST